MYRNNESWSTWKCESWKKLQKLQKSNNIDMILLIIFSIINWAKKSMSYFDVCMSFVISALRMDLAFVLQQFCIWSICESWSKLDEGEEEKGMKVRDAAHAVFSLFSKEKPYCFQTFTLSPKYHTVGNKARKTAHNTKNVADAFSNWIYVFIISFYGFDLWQIKKNGSHPPSPHKSFRVEIAFNIWFLLFFL